MTPLSAGSVFSPEPATERGNSVMAFYYIVKKRDLPASEGAANLGAICDAWAKSAQKDEIEVIAVSEDGKVICRFAPSESEEIACDFRNHEVSWLWKSN